MSGDELIEFEEGNYDVLVDKFIKKNQDKWDDFVHDEYMDSLGDIRDSEDR